MLWGFFFSFWSIFILFSFFKWIYSFIHMHTHLSKGKGLIFSGLGTAEGLYPCPQRVASVPGCNSPEVAGFRGWEWPPTCSTGVGIFANAPEPFLQIASTCIKKEDPVLMNPALFTGAWWVEWVQPGTNPGSSLELQPGIPSRTETQHPPLQMRSSCVSEV